jgi:signal transduction histidine kinase
MEMELKLRNLREIFFAPSRLRKKFLRTFFIVGVIPLLLIGAVSIYLINLVHRIDTSALERTVAEQTALEVRNGISDAVTSIDAETTGDATTRLSLEQQYTILASLLANTPHFRDLAFVCTHPEQCTPGFQTARLVRGRATNATLDLDYRDSSFFTAVQAGRSFVGPVNLNNTPPTIQIGVPFSTSNGDVISALVGTFELDALFLAVAEKQLGETGYAYLIDQTGTIIAHSDTSLIGTNIDLLFRTDPLSADLFVSENDQSLIYHSLSGERVSGLASMIPDLAWSVIVEWPRSETQQVVITMMWYVLQFAIGSLLLVFIIGSAFSFSLVRPINVLKQGTREIGQGNFAYRFMLHTKDELEELGERLNSMAVDLKSLEELNELKLRTDLLAESLKKEQEFSKLKDQFVRTVSHQFNTPLSIIHWTLEMITDPNVDPSAVKQGLSTIDESRRDILAMVNNLLTLSEIGFRYEKSKTRPLDMKKIMSDSVSKLHEEITHKSLTIQFIEHGENFLVDANEFALSKAIEHLLLNAIVYSDTNAKIEVTITAQEHEFIFSVHDYGIGIPEGEQKSIFQQFFRASNAVAKKNVSTGLGLFISKVIIEGHRGKIWFDSKEGEGSTFSFSLPREAKE